MNAVDQVNFVGMALSPAILLAFVTLTMLMLLFRRRKLSTAFVMVVGVFLVIVGAYFRVRVQSHSELPTHITLYDEFNMHSASSGSPPALVPHGQPAPLEWPAPAPVIETLPAPTPPLPPGYMPEFPAASSAEEAEAPQGETAPESAVGTSDGAAKSAIEVVDNPETRALVAANDNATPTAAAAEPSDTIGTEEVVPDPVVPDPVAPNSLEPNASSRSNEIASEEAGSSDIATQASDEAATASDKTPSLPDVAVEASQAQAEVTKAEVTEPQGGDTDWIQTAEPSAPATSDWTASAAPTHPEPLDERPSWVLHQPSEVEGKLAIVLHSDPFEDRFECERDLQRRTADVLRKYAGEYCRSRGIAMPSNLSIEPADIASAVRTRYYALRNSSVGVMTEGYQLTVFDDELQNKLTRRVEDAQIDHRLTLAGVCSGSVLALLTAFHGMFRFGARNATDPFSKFQVKPHER